MIEIFMIVQCLVWADPNSKVPNSCHLETRFGTFETAEQCKRAADHIPDHQFSSGVIKHSCVSRMTQSWKPVD